MTYLTDRGKSTEHLDGLYSRVAASLAMVRRDAYRVENRDCPFSLRVRIPPRKMFSLLVTNDMPSNLARSRAALLQSKQIMESTKPKERAFDVSDYRVRFDELVSEFEKAVFRLDGEDPIDKMKKVTNVCGHINLIQEVMTSHGVDNPGPMTSLKFEIPGIGRSSFFEGYTVNKEVVESYDKRQVMQWMMPGIESLQDYLEQFDEMVFGGEEVPPEV